MKATIHKMLNLPSTYEARTKIEGNLKDGRLVKLRCMCSQTGGHLRVWAAQFTGKDWEEISGEMFTIYASEIIGANYGKMSREIENIIAEHDAMENLVDASGRLVAQYNFKPNFENTTDGNGAENYKIIAVNDYFEAKGKLDAIKK